MAQWLNSRYPMPAIITDILSLLIAIAGWYYLFNSRAAANLQGVESDSRNRRRVRLRRAGGTAMLLLAVGLLVGFNTVDAGQSPHAYLLVWTAVMILLMIVVILALIDLRMTLKLRRNREGKD
jgi:UDP-N-acetylmuramyl pentapeptide phosphotransferase/UDP-N-acetylglucosamine-1-phosphate transferase